MKKIDTDKIVRAFEENPVAFMAATGAVLMGISKIIDAHGSAAGSRAYARQVNHSIARSRYKK